eukprot:Nk52_evm11s250 gene=Nk52_evmTU11s250
MGRGGGGGGKGLRTGHGGRVLDYWFQLECEVGAGKEEELAGILEQLRGVNSTEGSSAQREGDEGEETLSMSGTSGGTWGTGGGGLDSCGSSQSGRSTPLGTVYSAPCKGHHKGGRKRGKGRAEAGQQQAAAMQELVEHCGRKVDEFVSFEVVSRYPPHPSTSPASPSTEEGGNGAGISLQQQQGEDHAWVSVDSLPENILPKYCLPGGFLLTEEPLDEQFFHFALGNGTGPTLYFGCLVYSRTLSQTHPALSRMYGPACIGFMSHYPYLHLMKYLLVRLYNLFRPDSHRHPLPAPLNSENDKIQAEASPSCGRRQALDKPNALYSLQNYIVNIVGEIPLPPPGNVELQCTFEMGSYFISRPSPTDFPLADFSFSPLFKCLTPRKLLEVFVAVMLERRVIVLSKHLSLLAPACHALISLIYPFKWHHVFLPVVIRPDLAALAKSKSPFIIGVPPMCMDVVARFATFFDDILIVDLDNNKVKTQKALPLISQNRKHTLLNVLKSTETVGESMQYSKFFRVIAHDAVPEIRFEEDVNKGKVRKRSFAGLDYESCPYPASKMGIFGLSDTSSQKAEAEATVNNATFCAEEGKGRDGRRADDLRREERERPSSPFSSFAKFFFKGEKNSEKINENSVDQEVFGEESIESIPRGQSSSLTKQLMGAEGENAKLTNLRCAFLHFISSHFTKSYLSFIKPPGITAGYSTRYNPSTTYFDIDSYLASLPPECGHFMAEFLCTEDFNRFAHRRWLNEDQGMSVLLFEELMDTELTPEQYHVRALPIIRHTCFDLSRQHKCPPPQKTATVEIEKDQGDVQSSFESNGTDSGIGGGSVTSGGSTAPEGAPTKVGSFPSLSGTGFSKARPVIFNDREHRKNCSLLQLRRNARKKHKVDYDFGSQSTPQRSTGDLTAAVDGTDSPRIQRAKTAFSDLYRDIVAGLQNDPKKLFLSKMTDLDQDRLISKLCSHSYLPITESTWPLFLSPSGAIVNVKEFRKSVFYGGIEHSIRKDVWKYLLGYWPMDCTFREQESIREKKEIEYCELKMKWAALVENETELETIDGDVEDLPMRYEQFMNTRRQIVKDVQRTDRDHHYYEKNESVVADKLEHILCSYAMFNPQLGYIQGMSDLLSPILYVMEDEIDSYWCFKTYMDRMKILLEASDTGMKYELKAMSSLLAFADPEFHSYLTSEPEFLESYRNSFDEHNLVFCFRWFMLNFKREFDFNSILRLWESLWSEYLTRDFQLYVALALLKTHRDTIISNRMDSTEILQYLSNLKSNFDMNVDDILEKATCLAECIPVVQPTLLKKSKWKYQM